MYYGTRSGALSIIWIVGKRSFTNYVDKTRQVGRFKCMTETTIWFRSDIKNRWPNSLDCTDLKISVEPAVTQNCVSSVTYIKNRNPKWPILLGRDCNQPKPYLKERNLFTYMGYLFNHKKKFAVKCYRFLDYFCRSVF